MADASLCFELQYEPEMFAGLIYRMLRPKCTLLIFISGKIVITGCEVSQQAATFSSISSLTYHALTVPSLQSPRDGEKALGKIFPALLQYRLRDDISEEDESDDEDEPML
ncbi:unnamed protein product [Phytophthora fragariaefolia]|uniref:Unnamed protein product n=1 Tax=Phytophthora fragariaefolia TaxID=1490495 RepID=A0A9W6YMF7_9STRA|nr:unnamed protein product [Phytophthora fragariaefolia]